MPLRGLIFDMDGVLWQSGPAHRQAYLDTLTPVGITAFDYAKIAGQRTRDAIASLADGRNFSESEIDALAVQKSARALEQLLATNPVTTHALDVVERLSVRFPVALATSGSPGSAALFLDRNQARPLFQAVVTGADVALAKPAPDIFRAAVKALGVPAEDCLVVEDSVSGVQAACAGGCRVAGFTTGDPAPLRQAGAERILESLSELLPLTGCNDQKIWTTRSWAESAPPQAEWTTVIAAAGRGTRLDFEKPKVLFPLAGRTILDWLLDLFEPRSARVVIVASPAGRQAIEDHLLSSRRAGKHYRIALQEEPLGMGHAVTCALPLIETPNTMIVWGDQVALLPETIESCMSLHTCSGALATVPTLWRASPYIHFERESGSGRLSRVLQAREGDDMPEEGESDTGLFLFRSTALRRYLSDAAQSDQVRGLSTGEFNFLPILPLADALPGNVVTARIVREEESIGVNTREQAAALSQVLLARHASHTRA